MHHTVKDVIEALSEYNPHAEVTVIVHNRDEHFSIGFGSAEGATKATAEGVAFYVDRLNQNEVT